MSETQPKIVSVYPLVAQFYKDNPSLEYWPTALDRTRYWFDAMTFEQEISTRVLGVYRLKTGNKEYMYYSYMLFGKDQMSNEISWGDCKEGLVPIPVPHYDFVASEGKILATHIESLRDKYTLEWNDEIIKDMLQYTSVRHSCVEDLQYRISKLEKAVRNIEQEQINLYSLFKEQKVFAA